MPMDEEQLRKDIDDRVADLKKQTAEAIKLPLAGPIMNGTILVAEIAALADIIAKKHEAISKKLVGLTWALLILTGVLCLFTLALLSIEVFPKDSIAHNERKPTTSERQQANQNQQVVVPAVTNR